MLFKFNGIVFDMENSFKNRYSYLFPVFIIVQCSTYLYYLIITTYNLYYYIVYITCANYNNKQIIVGKIIGI